MRADTPWKQQLCTSFPCLLLDGQTVCPYTSTLMLPAVALYRVTEGGQLQTDTDVWKTPKEITIRTLMGYTAFVPHCKGISFFYHRIDSTSIKLSFNEFCL